MGLSAIIQALVFMGLSPIIPKLLQHCDIKKWPILACRDVFGDSVLPVADSNRKREKMAKVSADFHHEGLLSWGIDKWGEREIPEALADKLERNRQEWLKIQSEITTHLHEEIGE